MIKDLNETKLAELPAYDVCIVGSGPSGTTVANELRGSGLKVCVLESGRLKPTKHGDRLREVRSEGIHIKEYSRERVLGGASTTWSGLSSPLDPIDMKPRSFVQHSGWPVKREDLLPFYEKAAARYRFPPLKLFDSNHFGALRQKGDIQPSWKQVEEKIFLAAAEPQNFGREFKHIFEGEEIDLYLDATLIRLEGEVGKDRIIAAEVTTRSGRTFRLRAGTFVLATGGIENARILLNSRAMCSEGLGNEHDQVGRYFMNHPKNYYGIIRLKEPVKNLPYYFGCLHEGFAGYAGLKLEESLQEEKSCLNSYVRFEPLFPWSDNQGVEAFVMIAKQCRGLLRSWRKSKGGKVVSLRDYSETGDDTALQNERKSFMEWLGLFFKIFFNFPQVLRYLYYRLFEKANLRIKNIRLRNFIEMEPHPENRVVLGTEKDFFGQPVPVARHDCMDRDRQSLIALHDLLAREVSRSGLGELSSDLREEDPWPIDLDASHHMGTTRMGDDPRFSVVNADLRLHSVENVFLAGGSVFPTSGCANPTFTMVALSIRLAEHLKEKVFK
ncbi:MAG: GMC oxidoreductase [Planctomycetota bacterium]|jgi:choline dehydrogenase-like flavoprotein